MASRSIWLNIYMYGSTFIAKRMAPICLMYISCRSNLLLLPSLLTLISELLLPSPDFRTPPPFSSTSHREPHGPLSCCFPQLRPCSSKRQSAALPLSEKKERLEAQDHSQCHTQSVSSPRRHPNEPFDCDRTLYIPSVLPSLHYTAHQP